MGSVVDATNASVAAASHLDVDGKDAGAIAALLAVARKIDDLDTIIDAVMETIEREPESNVKMPPADNVSLPTYLKYCEALGLTPSSRGLLGKMPAETQAAETDLERFQREQREKREQSRAG